jgi:hypothetical protein
MIVMKKMICFLILTLGILACSSEENARVEGNFEFIAPYTTQITVGGVVGIQERTFKIGETFSGISEENGDVTIKIAEHSVLNDNCPSNTCYQEFLNVPRKYLKLKK